MAAGVVITVIRTSVYGDGKLVRSLVLLALVKKMVVMMMTGVISIVVMVM